MRVIGGSLGGRRLRAPAGWATRPSSDRLREALFNILGEGVRGSVFVDAYAGTGAVGIEAWSRGAREVIWIESEAAALGALRENLRDLGIAGTGRVVGRRVRAGLGEVAAHGGCDYFFLDPPYAEHGEYAAALAALARRPGVAGPGTRIVGERRRRDAPPPVAEGLEVEREHAMGEALLTFYRRRAG